VKADDRDELAQEFVRAHSDAELKALGQSAAGKGALALSVNELAKGSVYQDEADDARRVGTALGAEVDIKVNSGWSWERVSGAVHTVLDVAGFIPGLGAIPDLVNAGIYAAEGDYKNAALSSVAAVPLAGDAVKGGAIAVKAGRQVLKHGDEALAVGTQVAKHGDEAAAVAAKTSKATKAASEVTGRVGRNDVKWTVDANGSTVQAEAHLREVFSGAKRSSAEVKAQGEAAALGKADDVGGHILGHRFVENQGSKNLFPQNTQFNNSAYRTLENEWAGWIKSGKEVQVDVRLSGGTATRPDKIEVFYKVIDPASGKTVMKNSADFTNEAGQVFNRVPSKEM
jgi:DNA/RNA non-specific endonuclease